MVIEIPRMQSAIHFFIQVCSCDLIISIPIFEFWHIPKFNKNNVWVISACFCQTVGSVYQLRWLPFKVLTNINKTHICMTNVETITCIQKHFIRVSDTKSKMWIYGCSVVYLRQSQWSIDILSNPSQISKDSLYSSCYSVHFRRLRL